MGKLAVGVTRFLPLFCVVILVFPVIATSQSPLPEKFPAKGSDWLLILTSIIAFANAASTAWLYLRISASQIDDNIINATNSILTLLERAKNLEPREKRLLADWLTDWEYFEPPRFIKRRSSVRKETIENLKQYFNEPAQ